MSVNRPKRVMTIQSMASFGRSSIAVVAPALSAMGIQCCPIPTIVLSTHTGNLGKPAVTPLTEQVRNTLPHYKELGLDFEGIYTGYLGKEELVSICKEYYDAYPNALKVCDPVMGDNGAAYSGIGKDLIDSIADLCAKADIITPNQTEAAMLLGMTEKLIPMPRERAERWCRKLMEICPKVVMTGIIMVDGKRYNVIGEGNEVSFQPIDYVKAGFPGTGDLFTAVLTGSMLRTGNLSESVQFASDFVHDAIVETIKTGQDPRFGVCFETVINKLFGE